MHSSYSNFSSPYDEQDLFARFASLFQKDIEEYLINALFFLTATSLLIVFPLYSLVFSSNEKKYGYNEHLDALLYYSHKFIFTYHKIIFIVIILNLGNLVLLLFHQSAVLLISGLLITDVIAYNILLVMLNVQNILLVLIGLQKCLIFCFPKLKSHISPRKKRFKGYLINIIIIGIIVTYAGTVAGWACLVYFFLDLFVWSPFLCDGNVELISMYMYFSMNFIIWFCMVFYIAILIGLQTPLKKLIRERPIPNDYVIISTIGIGCTKLLDLPLILLKYKNFVHGSGFATEENQESNQLMLYFELQQSFFWTEIITISLVIQLSYLFCHRSELKRTLLIYAKKRRTFCSVFCCKNIEVDPA